MSGIFVCYRRQADHAAARLQGDLERRFGVGKVFIDVDRIELGDDWRDTIHQALAASGVLLSVIQPGWIEDQRLFDESDVLRYELESALKSDMLVIPLLVDGAPPPKQSDLPEVLRSLADRQAWPLRHKTWQSDMRTLTDTIARHVDIEDAPVARPVSYLPDIRARQSAHAELVGRDDELDELVNRSTEDGYLVIEGTSWGGKTALVTHLAQRLGERDGTSVVQFFIVERDNDTADAFLDAVNPQLSGFVGNAGEIPLSAQGKARQFKWLWQEASHRLGPHERLVLCVDGLDEQSTNDPISKHLPIAVAEGTTVVVTTRPQPPFRKTVHRDHALARVDRRRVLSLAPYPGAEETRDLARQAIQSAVSGADPKLQAIVGFLAFGMGPFHQNELEELVNIPPGEVMAQLAPFSRHMLTFNDPEGVSRFKLGHNDLASEGRKWFGSTGDRDFTDRILAWADEYQQRGWPPDTPGYLVWTLDTLVQHAKWRPDRLERLIALASDERLALMRSRLWHPLPLLKTIGAAYSASIRKEGHRLRSFRLAVQECEISSASGDVSPSVVKALAETRSPELALELAFGISHTWRRQLAIEAAMRRLAETNVERALEVAEKHRDESWYDTAMVSIVASLAKVDGGRAIEAARSIEAPIDRAEALALVAEQAGNTQWMDEAVALALASDDEVRRSVLDEGLMDREELESEVRVTKAVMRHDVAGSLASMDEGRALDMARSIEGTWHKVRALIALADRLGDPQLIDEAVAEAETMPYYIEDKQFALIEAAEALAARDPDRALAIARDTPVDSERARALARVAAVTGRADLVAEALEITRGFRSYEKFSLRTIAPEIARTDPACAADLARSFGDAELRANVLGSIAAATKNAELANEAFGLALSIGGVKERHAAIASVIGDVAAMDVDLALAVVAGMPQHRRSLLRDIAERVALQDPSRATVIARGIDDPAHALAAVAAATEDRELMTEALATSGGRRSESEMPDMARLLARLDPGAALAAADRIQDEVLRAEALASVAGATGTEEVIAMALDAARTLDEAEGARTLAYLAGELGKADLLDEALHGLGVEWFRDDPKHGYIVNSSFDGEVPEALASLAARVDPYKAVELAEALGDPMRTKVTIDAAKHLARTKPYEATKLASELSPGGRAVALAAVGRITGDIGLVDDALDVARDSSVKTRAGALAAVAAAWATVEPGGDAEPLLWLAERWKPESPDDESSKLPL